MPSCAVLFCPCEVFFIFALHLIALAGHLNSASSSLEMLMLINTALVSRENNSRTNVSLHVNGWGGVSAVNMPLMTRIFLVEGFFLLITGFKLWDPPDEGYLLASSNGFSLQLQRIVIWALPEGKCETAPLPHLVRQVFLWRSIERIFRIDNALVFH